jgi:hypothetical protein
VKYYVNGRMIRESTRTEDKRIARRILKLREGAVASGTLVTPRLDRILYDELAADLKQHYKTTGRRRLDEVEDRFAYLTRFFRGWRAVAILPDLITQYVAKRQAQRTKFKRPTSNRTINIELALLKRMFRLGYEHGKVIRVPPIKMLSPAKPSVSRQRLSDGSECTPCCRRFRSHPSRITDGRPARWSASAASAPEAPHLLRVLDQHLADARSGVPGLPWASAPSIGQGPLSH